MTHVEYMQIKKLTILCASWHLTFNGRCLNCGYEPEKDTHGEK